MQYESLKALQAAKQPVGDAPGGGGWLAVLQGDAVQLGLHHAAHHVLRAAVVALHQPLVDALLHLQQRALQRPAHHGVREVLPAPPAAFSSAFSDCVRLHALLHEIDELGASNTR